MVSEERRRTVALILVAVALGLLFAGRFVTFDPSVDSSDWIFPIGLVAILPAAAAPLVAWPEPRALLWLAVVLTVLTLLIAGLGWAVGSFRFVWSGSEGELWLLVIVLFLLSTTLFAVAGVAFGRGWWLVRIPAYLTTLFVLFVSVTWIVTDYYERSCTGQEEEGCWAGLGGLFMGGIAVLLALPLIVPVELILWWGRRRKAAVSRQG
jgi:hypothetical protein